MGRQFTGSTQIILRGSAVLTAMPTNGLTFLTRFKLANHADAIFHNLIQLGRMSGGAGNESGWNLGIDNTGKIYARTIISTANTDAFSSNAVPDELPHTAGGVWLPSNASRRAWLDDVGGTAETTSRVPDKVINDTGLGCYKTSGTGLFDNSGHTMEWAAIYNAALDDAEMKMAAYGVPPPFIRPGSLVACCALEDVAQDWRGPPWTITGAAKVQNLGAQFTRYAA